jgi:hypothetical protein
MAVRYAELQDEHWLRQKYELEGRTTYAIAAELGCSDATVSRALRRFGIQGRLGRPAAVKPAEVYGLLTVLSELAERDRGGRSFLCRCDCGSTHAVRAGTPRTASPACGSGVGSPLTAATPVAARAPGKRMSIAPASPDRAPTGVHANIRSMTVTATAA